MMLIFAFIIGIGLPGISGWMLIRLIEQKVPVLQRYERWALGCIAGQTFTMFLTFMFHVLGIIKLSAAGMLGIQILTAAVMIAVCLMKREDIAIKQATLPPLKIEGWTRVLTIGLGLWIGLKLITGGMQLVSVPAYQDDIFQNWNYRAKVYLETHQLTHEHAIIHKGFQSYPPTVPLMKTWMSHVYGSWHEGLANSLNILWYVCLMILLFGFLRRKTDGNWALLGTYLFASLPLPFMHGTTAYADIFLAAYIFATASLLQSAFDADDKKQQRSFLLLAALMAGLMTFTKNEAMLIYLPPLVLIFIAIVYFGITFQEPRSKNQMRSGSWFLVLGSSMIAIFALPWLLYKWSNEFSFGNAKSITGLGLGWQPGVLESIWANLFLQGNWLLLFPVFFGLLFLQRKRLLEQSWIVLLSYFFIVFFGQIFIFLFTSVAPEATQQTGYGRGLVHIVPIVVVVTVLMMRNYWKRMQHC